MNRFSFFYHPEESWFRFPYYFPVERESLNLKCNKLNKTTNDLLVLMLDQQTVTEVELIQDKTVIVLTHLKLPPLIILDVSI